MLLAMHTADFDQFCLSQHRALEVCNKQTNHCMNVPKTCTSPNALRWVDLNSTTMISSTWRGKQVPEQVWGEVGEVCGT